jgi:hypothetical protein
VSDIQLMKCGTHKSGAIKRGWQRGRDSKPTSRFRRLMAE